MLYITIIYINLCFIFKEKYKNSKQLYKSIKYSNNFYHTKWRYIH